MPLSSTGYRARRSSEILSSLRSGYVARLIAAGLSGDVSFDDADFLGMFTAVVATLLGEAEETIQAVYDSRVRANAAGAQLDNLGALVGVLRNAATASTVSLTLTGTNGTVIPAGKVVEGGGIDGDQRWTLDASATISGGSATVSATASTLGRISAEIGDVSSIVTPVSGWAGVTNAVAATPGSDLESDQAYRLRMAQSLQIAGAASTASIRAVVAALDFVEAVAVVENPSATAATVDGVSLTAHSLGVIVWPNGMTTAQKETVAAAIYGRAPAGVETVGSITAEIIGVDGASKTVGFSYASSVTVNVVATVSLLSGYDLSDVEDAVDEAITHYISGDSSASPPVEGLSVGDDVRIIQILRGIADIEGIAGASITLNGSPSDVTILATQIPALGSVTVTT